MSVKFELEDDEAVALMQCAAAGAQAAQVLLGGNARPMGPIFQKIQAQFTEQRPMLQPASTMAPSGNGGAKHGATVTAP